MKKHLIKIVALVFCMALFLTGCATVSDVKINGKNANYKTAQYQQGQVVKVGDYLYFGNGYTASDSEGFSYKKATKSGYLSRVKINNDFTYASGVKDVDKNILLQKV